MKNLGKALIISVSFFTTIPMPFIEWDSKSNRYVPLFIPLIGILIGSLFYLLYYGLSFVEISSFLKAVLLVGFFIMITGGLHMDAFMDTCDAHFSRRPMERKIEIMKDSNIGAFAALYLVIFLLLKTALIYEILEHNINGLILICIPFLSRLLQSLMLLNTKFAKDDGLALMYGSLPKKFQMYYIIYIFIMGFFALYFLDIVLVTVLLGVATLSFFYHRHFAKKSFGGITGDVVGAYIEIVEVLMLLGVVFYELV